MGTTPESAETPRAVIHKQILDAAKRRPQASLEGLAGQVSGASVGLVEEVLEEYGDPAPAEPEEEGPEHPPAADGATGHAGESPSSEDEPTAGDGPSPDDGPDGSGDKGIPENARETLQLLREHPGASQADLAERMEVAKSTINRWLHAIDGFDWADRHDFVAEHLDGAGGGTDAGQRPLDRRVAALERQVTRESGSTVPPELAHRVVHTCMESERFSEEEELRLVRAVMGGDAADPAR